MASMRTVLMMISALIVLPLSVRAQRCMGTINFTIREGDPVSGLVTPIPFMIDVSYPYYFDHAVSSDGRYTIAAYRIVNGERVEPMGSFQPTSSSTHSVMMYGCRGDYEMVVTRRPSGEHPDADSMSILFINACDETFGMDVPFRPGRYSVLVCDTTKIPVDPAKSVMGYTYRPLEEQYPSRLYDGYDISGSLVSRDRGTYPEEARYFFGRTMMRYRPFPNLLCVQLVRNDPATRSAFDDLCRSLGLVEEQGYDTIRDPREKFTSITLDAEGNQINPIGVPPLTNQGVVVVRRDRNGVLPYDSSAEVRALRASPLVAFAGPIVSLNRRKIVAFDNRITIYLSRAADTSMIAHAARALGLTVLYGGYISGTRIFGLLDDPGAMYGIAGKAESMSFLRGVTSTEMSLQVFEDPSMRWR